MLLNRVNHKTMAYIFSILLICIQYVCGQGNVTVNEVHIILKLNTTFTPPSTEAQRIHHIIYLKSGDGRIIDDPLTRPDFCQLDVALPHNNYDNCSTCANHCGQMTALENKYKKTAYCSCDFRCKMYHDCCPDFHSQCPKEVDKAYKVTEPPRQKLSECIQYSGHPYYLLINKCQYSGHACMTYKHGGFPDPILAVPVVDLMTGVHYINTQCARCNGIKNIIPWNMDFNCHPKDGNFYREKLSNLDRVLDLIRDDTTLTTVQQMRILFQLKDLTCNMKYEPVMYETLRDCTPTNAVCHPDCMNSMLKELCYSSDVQSYITDSSTTYRNYFCALCQDKTTTPLWCGRAPQFSFIKPDIGIGHFSLALLMDIDTRQGGKVGHVKQCGKGSMWNQHNSQCVPITCPSGYTLSDNQMCIDNSQTTITVKLRCNMNITKCIWPSQEDIHFILSSLRFSPLIINVNLTGNMTAIDMTVDTECVTNSNILQLNISATIVFDGPAPLEHFKGEEEVVLHSFKSLITDQVVFRLTHLLEVYIFTWDYVSENITLLSYLQVCAGIKYEAGKYEMRNNTVYIPERDKVYNTSQYMMEGGVVWVCVSPSSDTTSTSASSISGILTLVCTSLSIICLLCRIIIQCLSRRSKLFPLRLQLQLCLSLLVAFVCLLVSPLAVSIPTLCSVLAACKHWTFLAAFGWMNNIGIDTVRVFVTPFGGVVADESQPLYPWLLSAWLLPAIPAILAFCLEYTNIDVRFRPTYTSGHCWFSQRYALIIYFVIPVALSMIINIVCFLLTSSALRKSFHESHAILHVSERRRQHGVYIKLFFLMGLTWIIGFIAPFMTHPAFWYIFIILNGCQGVFLLISYLMAGKSAVNLCPCIKARRKPSDSTVSHPTLLTSTNMSMQRKTKPVTESELS